MEGGVTRPQSVLKIEQTEHLYYFSVTVCRKMLLTVLHSVIQQTIQNRDSTI